MDTRRCRGLVLALLLTMASSARAADEAGVVKEAAALLEQIASDPDSGIPTPNLREASGILIMPHVVETQFGMGRKRGYGIFLSRDEHGEWGHPEPFEISGLSVGARAGRKVTDIVVIYPNRKAAEEYGETSIVLTLARRISGSLRRKNRFYPTFSEQTLANRHVIVFVRHRGLLAGTAFTAERSWGPSFAPPDRKTGAAAEPEVAEGKAPATAARHASNPHSNSRLVSDSPDTVHLKRLLTELSNRPPAQVAATGRKDVTVRPAGGVKPIAETAAPLR
jgi:lipid-binding SYLF domain-containing protein